MSLSRTRWLAALGAIVVGSGLALRVQWPSAKSALDCPVEDVRWIDAGTAMVATCAPGTPPGHVPAGSALTLGAKLNLNDATAEELVLVPGIGPTLASSLVKARTELGGFRSWEEVHAVTGVGAVKLESLKRWTILR